MLVKLNQIDIPERFRQEYGDLKDLKESLEKFGQLQTILLLKKEDGRYELVCGCRRLLAAQQAEFEEVEVIVKEGLDDLLRREMEVEENIRRKNFTWQEEVKAKHELLLIRERRAGDGLWGSPRLKSAVATELGESEGGVNQDIRLAEALEKYPELAKEEKKTAALKKLKQIEQGRVRSALAQISSIDEKRVELFYGDCREYLTKLGDRSVDLIITDPPWGANVEDSEFAGNYKEVFEDSEVEAFEVVKTTLPILFRVLKNDGSMLIFFATKHYTTILEMVEAFGFEVQPIPLIWPKNVTQNIHQFSKITPNYETIFWAQKGSPKLVKPTKAILPDFPVPGSKVHPTQKPIGLIKHLIESLSIEDELILDPFAGSGSTVLAALETNRRVIGCEKRKYFYDYIFTEASSFFDKKEE